MARGRPAQPSFAWGELTDQAGGRIDLPQYAASAKRLVNYQVLETGAVTRRAGTRFVAFAKYSDRPTALAGFTFSAGEAYILELAEGAIRFYRGRTQLEASPGVPLEVTTPYLGTDVSLLKMAQSADVLYLASNFYGPRKLERYGNLTWRLRDVCNTLAGSPRPSREYGTRPPAGATLTLSATTGTGVTITSAAAVFLASDVLPAGIGVRPREILVFDGVNIAGRATIVTYVSPTEVTADITQAFVSTGPISETDWKITASPLATATPSIAGPVGTQGTIALDIAGFRAGDNGGFLAINGGLVELGTPNTDQEINMVVRSALSMVTPSPPGAWSLEEPSWSSYNGFPAAVVLGQGRAWWAGTLAQPDTLWGSKSADYENFAAGVLDDDAVTDTLVSAQVNRIIWLAMTDALYAGTAGSVFKVSAGNPDGIITPTNVDSKPAVAYGVRPEAAPLAVGPALLYPSVSGRKLREMVFDIYTERQLAPDLLLLANHLTRPQRARGIVTPRGLLRTAYQQEPVSTVWGVLESGEWIACSYLREQNVIGWAPLVTAGIVRDVAVIRREDGAGDEVWLVVERVIGGVTRVCIEVVDDIGLIYDRLHVDCAATVDGLGQTLLTPDPDAVTLGASIQFAAFAAAFSAADLGRQVWQLDGPGQAEITAYHNPTLVTATVLSPFSSAAGMIAGTWGIARTDVDGLAHLEGATVKVVGDGAVQADQVVASGAIVAQFPAIAFEVGLGYTSTLVTQRVPIPDAQGQPKGQPLILVRLLDSLGLVVNGRRVDFRIPEHPMGQPPPLFTGDKHVPHLGLSTDGLLTLVQDQPLPSTILYVQALTHAGAG